ncbi:hypothetical protein CFOL_v3_04599 [Cephalotus follicularis]|uniref:CCHC-type domain-containing protein n=1 Tax=Cephalotus follicularis TaxID=3775 RepID=A0A1Q3AZ85_CEPFO|nr:hypothetical protein CFOL_v3_04599 [Cephalotus follicularis]
MRQFCVQTQQAKRTRQAPSEWQDGDSSTKSSRNRSQQTIAQGTPSQGSKVKSRNYFYYGHVGHIQKDCWEKNGLCLRCGASSHMLKDCRRGKEIKPIEPCLHCGRNSHELKDCWWKSRFCMKCGAPDHLWKDCPTRQVTVPTGPTSDNGATAGLS